VDTFSNDAGNNTLQIWVTLTNPSTLYGVINVTFQLSLKNATIADSFNESYKPGSTGGNAAFDGSYVKVENIELPALGYFTLHFNATTKQSNEFNGLTATIDMDNITTDLDTSTDNDFGVMANFSNSSGTITGATILSAFSRGPVRQGVEMSYSTNVWSVRGFIENLANSLNYSVSEWHLYMVNESGQVNTSYVQNGTILSVGTATQTSINGTDGRGYTAWNTTDSSGKPFFAPEFVWEVKWNGSSLADYTRHWGVINATMDFDNIGEIDITTSKSIDTGSDYVSSTVVPIKCMEYVQHSGSSALNASFIQILSVIPNFTTTGTATNWTINTSSINVTYMNSSNGNKETQLLLNSSQNDAWNITIQPEDAVGGNGLINITINNLNATGVPEQYLMQNDQIKLYYTITSSAGTSSGDVWQFGGNASVKTFSGTPIRELNNVTFTGGEKSLIAFKEVIARNPNQPNNISVLIYINVSDVAGGGISGIYFADYVPAGTSFDRTIPEFRFYNASEDTWYLWSVDTEYNLTNQSTSTLPDGVLVETWLYNATLPYSSATSPGWTLQDGDTLVVNYTVNVTDEGLYTLPTIISAFDPNTGESVGTTAFAAIVVSLPESMNALTISEKELELSQFVTINQPARWRKEFQVFNPNSRRVSGNFKTEIFRDTIDVSVSYSRRGAEVPVPFSYETDGNKRYLSWESDIGAFETRDFTIRAYTPPVIETDKQIVGEVEKVDENTVRIVLDMFFKNTAGEDYDNVRIYMPTEVHKIESITEKGRNLDYWGSGNTTVIEIKDFKAGELKAVRVVYLGSFPIVIVKTDRDEYETGMPVGMTVLIINGGRGVDKPYIETEVYSEFGDLVRTTVEQGRSLSPLEKDEHHQKFTIPHGSPTGSYLANIRFREDYAIIGTGSTSFFVRGVSRTMQGISYVILFSTTLFVLYFSGQRIKHLRDSTKRKKEAQVV